MRLGQLLSLSHENLLAANENEFPDIVNIKLTTHHLEVSLAFDDDRNTIERSIPMENIRGLRGNPTKEELEDMHWSSWTISWPKLNYDISNKHLFLHEIYFKPQEKFWLVPEIDGSPNETADYLAKKKGKGEYLRILIWDNRAKHWNKEDGDEYFCESEDIEFYYPIKILPAYPKK